jgi:glycosyltransferase XagB
LAKLRRGAPIEVEPEELLLTVDSSIGEILVERGVITAAQRDDALTVQARTGSTLGSILVSIGAIHPRDLYVALADAWGAEYIDASRIDPNAELLAGLDVDYLIKRGWVPVSRDDEGTVVVATAQRPTPSLQDEMEVTLGQPVRIAMTSHWSVSKAIQLGYRDEVVDRATQQLWREQPGASARSVLDHRQSVIGSSALAGLIVVLVVWPKVGVSALTLALATSFLVGVAFKFALSLLGARVSPADTVSREEVAALSENDLPIYTVLVPCYRETGVVASLVSNLGRLDYPADKLEILLLLEADDTDTLESAIASNPNHTITFVIIPDGPPKTKPKACNVGLMLARGEHLVVFDAGDRPDPDQLKRAIIAFRKAPVGTVCLQAGVDYVNAEENLLTRLFTLEHSFWFDHLRPAPGQRNHPIALGGTSTHFVTDALRHLGGWDPFNVTEDADLGLRVAARGLQTGMIDSKTTRPANRRYRGWLRHRSRWVKGHMQTALVHSRRPMQLTRAAGVGPALGFGLLIGGTALSFLAVIPLYVLAILTFTVPTDVLDRVLPSWVTWAGLTSLLVSNALMVIVLMLGAFRRRRYALIPLGLIYPLYWIMHSVAAYRAMAQLIRRPHHWDKTQSVDEPQA